jgi:hypothetical protein
VVAVGRSDRGSLRDRALEAEADHGMARRAEAQSPLVPQRQFVVTADGDHGVGGGRGSGFVLARRRQLTSRSRPHVKHQLGPACQESAGTTHVV